MTYELDRELQWQMHKRGENGNNMAETRDVETKRDQQGF
jgi:hypothetical protein